MTILSELAELRRGKTGRSSSWDKTGRNADYWRIPAGKSRILADIKGPGVITHIWMTQPGGYRDCLLKITWDDAPYPSVLCPLGDFFGLGHGIVNSYQSLLFSASTSLNNQFGGGCALNCYAPMPFRRRAVVELVNEGAAEQMQYFYVDYERTDRRSLAANGYFHAEFRRTNPFGGWAHEITKNAPEANIINTGKTAWANNYVLLETRGRGHYLGCNLSVANFQGGWWGEGDDMIWVDGYKWPPDLHGTGSEDYLNQAWGMQPNAFLRNGSSIHEADTGGYQTSYVHHLDNPVRFQKSVKVTIEVGHGNHLANDVSSVAYWYAARPTAIAVPPPVAQRQPVKRNKDGQWVKDPTNKCPGKPVALNDEMRVMKQRWVDIHKPVAPKWAPRFADRWLVSKLVPKRTSVARAVPAGLKDTAMAWRPVKADTSHCMDIHALFAGQDGIVHFGNRFLVGKTGRWTIELGHDGGAAVFVDGRRVLCEPELRNPAFPNRSHVVVVLGKGEHEIVVAFDLAEGRGWGIFFAFTVPPEDRKSLRVVEYPRPVVLS